MKKNLLAIAGILSLMITTGKSQAQSLNSVPMENVKAIVINSSVFPETKSTATAADLSTINVKAVKNFKRSYKDASNETWATTADGFTASFNAAGISNKIFYDTKGKWSGSLKGYTEDKMDADVRSIVKNSYAGYKINYVKEVETPASLGAPTYIVYIENNNSIKLVRVCNGDMDVYQEFQKQK